MPQALTQYQWAAVIGELLYVQDQESVEVGEFEAHLLRAMGSHLNEEGRDHLKHKLNILGLPGEESPTSTASQYIFSQPVAPPKKFPAVVRRFESPERSKRIQEMQEEIDSLKEQLYEAEMGEEL